MPSIGQTHYRCGFDLTPAAETLDWGDIIKTIRAWISRLNPGVEGLGGRWFYAGGDWKCRTAPRTHVHIRTCIGTGTETAPQGWALRFEHQCKEVPHRLWITDIGVTRLDNDQYRVLLHLYNRLNPNYVGPEPSNPTSTAPGVVTSFFRSTRFTPIAGSLTLKDSPLDLPLGQGEIFHDLLVSETRLTPIVLVTRIRETNQTAIDPAILARKLIGNALVYVASNPEVDEELDYFLGDDFRCRNGMVRIFQPHVRFGTSDFRRHRFFLKDYIRETGPEPVFDQITTALNKRAHRWIGAGAESIEDIESECRRHRLSQLLKAAEDDQTKELLTLFESENTQLAAERDTARRRIEALELSVEEKTERVDQSSFEAKQARADAERAHERARTVETRLNAVNGLSTLPVSIPAVLILIERLHAGRIVFTRQAHKSAESTEFPDINSCWSCLWQMATVLHELHFRRTAPLAAGEIEQQFKEATGIDLVMTEGKQTKADNRLMALRQVTHEGRTFDITPHAKLRTRNTDLRIHYSADHEKTRLVVGHCGDHLETYGTRRRKEG